MNVSCTEKVRTRILPLLAVRLPPHVCGLQKDVCLLFFTFASPYPGIEASREPGAIQRFFDWMKLLQCTACAPKLERFAIVWLFVAFS